MLTPGAVVLSAAITAALFAMAMFSPRGTGEIGVEQRGLTREVRYLLPLLPPSKKVDGAGLNSLPDIRWGGGPLPTGLDGMFAGGGGQVGPGRGRHGKAGAPIRGVTPLPVPDSERVGGPVYVASELDQRVERDPSSAAPVYPPYLEAQRIEGAVTVSYVVDTTGLADSASLHVQTSSNPAFSEAVRAALPGMRFRPAALRGRPVRQLVMQEFRFVIVPRADSVLHARRGRRASTSGH